MVTKLGPNCNTPPYTQQ